jgi:hypothetical protein
VATSSSFGIVDHRSNSVRRAREVIDGDAAACGDSRMRAIGLVAVVVVAVVGIAASACDKKPDTGATTSGSASTAVASSSASASASSSASSAAGHPGACKQMLAEKSARCDAMAKGDPTIESACKEAIDRLTTAGDDARCWTAMNPPEVGPPQDDVPE